MIRMSSFTGLCLLYVLAAVSAQDGEKKAPKKVPPFIEEVLKLTPDEFIKRFDKDGDGKLTRDELPPFFAKAFAAADKDGDGKLNREEVATMLQTIRQFFAAGGPPKGPIDVEKVVDNLLKQFDTNQDGKISRQEAKGRLADIFDQMDQNKDGFLDRKELRALAERMQANAKKGGPAAANEAMDFDALDKNADGRLSRDELKGTPWYNRFAEIDTDKNGQIDRREFEAFLEREREKTITNDKKTPPKK